MAARIVLRNGHVVDGNGTPMHVADVAIGHDGKITAIGPNLAVQGDEEVDCTGHIVAPGFVDLHTHFDAQWCVRTNSVDESP